MTCAFAASFTIPRAGSTVTTHTPLPVMWWARASYGYGGCGFDTAKAFAFDIDMAPGAWGALIGAALIGLFRRGGGVVSSTNSGFTSGIGGASGIGISSGGGVG